MRKQLLWKSDKRNRKEMGLDGITEYLSERNLKLFFPLYFSAMWADRVYVLFKPFAVIFFSCIQIHPNRYPGFRVRKTKQNKTLVCLHNWDFPSSSIFSHDWIQQLKRFCQELFDLSWVSYLVGVIFWFHAVALETLASLYYGLKIAIDFTNSQP